MTRIFRRGELKLALLHVLATAEPANGYAIMQHVTDQIGAGWRASPGSIYPALLALEDAGHITGRDEDGSRLYRLTESGRGICDDRPDPLDVVASRASSRERRVTLGGVLDGFAREGLDRSAALEPLQEQDIRAILATTVCRISIVLDQGATDD